MRPAAPPVHAVDVLRPDHGFRAQEEIGPHGGRKAVQRAGLRMEPAFQADGPALFQFRQKTLLQLPAAGMNGIKAQVLFQLFLLGFRQRRRRGIDGRADGVKLFVAAKAGNEGGVRGPVSEHGNVRDGSVDDDGDSVLSRPEGGAGALQRPVAFPVPDNFQAAGMVQARTGGLGIRPGDDGITAEEQVFRLLSFLAARRLPAPELAAGHGGHPLLHEPRAVRVHGVQLQTAG